MLSSTAHLVERVYAQLEIIPLDWESPRSAEEYHSLISQAVYDIADLTDSYQQMHSQMTGLYHELGDLRRIGEYMASLPSFGVVESRCAVQDALSVVMEQRNRLTVDMLSTGRFAEILGRGMRTANDGSDELFQLGRKLFSVINTRTIVYSNGTKGKLEPDWSGRVDGIRSLNEAIKSIRNNRQVVLEYLGGGDYREERRQWSDAMGHWDYIHNCPAYAARAPLDHQRNAREWAMITPALLTTDMFPYLDAYVAKLVLSHGQLLFRLNMLYHYHQLAASVVDYYRALLEEGENHYVPDHPGYRDFVKIKQYLEEGY